MRLPTDKGLATIAEYLQYETAATQKHEYRDGEIVAMAGGSGEHSLIVANVIRELGVALKGKPCRVYDSNLRMGIPGTPLFTYPDSSVICGAIQWDQLDPSGQTATNPKVLIEVLSPSTEGYDRGKKFSNYCKLDSLEEYVLVSQEEPRVEVFHRQGDGTWVLSRVLGLEGRVRLKSVGVEVAMGEIYAGVELSPQ